MSVSGASGKIAMSGNTPRYCQCGSRLARDHAGDLCGSCEREAALQAAEPPAVSMGFWETEAFQDAFAAQHIGRVARAFRRHPEHVARFGRDGISQERLGSWLGLTQAQVSRIENGAPIRNLDTLAYWARVLRVPPHLLWFRLPSATASPESDAAPGAGQHGAVLNSGIYRRPVAVPPPQQPHGPDALAMRVFRSADLQAGGGHVYASVIRYLQADMAPRLFGSDAGADDQGLFTAAAALTEMAGWMAHDSGRDATAQRHFGRALALVRIGGDHQLSAHVMGSMSHLASHLGQPDQAIALARQGQKALRAGAPNPQLEARMLALEARGHAAALPSADSSACARLLLRAERVLEEDGPPIEEISPWVNGFDAGSLASEAARCMRHLGDLGQARVQAERVITLRPSHRTRSRAFGQLALVTVLIAQGEIDHACAIAAGTLGATHSLGSYLVIDQLIQVQQRLQPYRGSPAVAEFLDCLQNAVRDRLPFYQLLARGQQDHHGGQEGM
jgi:hypothetical protein